jgi:hypothetical protein
MYEIVCHLPGSDSEGQVIDTVEGQHAAEVETNGLNSDAHWDQSSYRYYYRLAR